MALDGGGTFQLGDVAAASKELVGIGDHGVGCASEDSRRYDMMHEFESEFESVSVSTVVRHVSVR